MLTFALDGSIPRALYRFFDDEQFADALANGQVWITTLEACRKCEQPGRGDAGEGSHLYNSGARIVGGSNDPAFREIGRRSGIKIGAKGVSDLVLHNNQRAERLHNAWVLCTTEEYRSDGLEGIGRYCVELAQPEEFFARLSTRLDQAYGVSEAIIGRIRYTNRAYEALQPPPGPIGFVKPPDVYAAQKEVRMLWVPLDAKQSLEPAAIRCDGIKGLCRRVS